MSLDDEAFVPVRIEHVALHPTANKVFGGVGGCNNHAPYNCCPNEKAVIFVASPTKAQQAMFQGPLWTVLA